MRTSSNLSIQRWSLLTFYITIGTMAGVILLLIGSWATMCCTNNTSSSPRVKSKTNNAIDDITSAQYFSGEKALYTVPYPFQFHRASCPEMIEINHRHRTSDNEDAFPTPPPSSHWETIDLNGEMVPRM